MRIALAVLVVVLFVGVAGASEWAIAVGGSDCDLAFAIQQTNDGGHIVVGLS